MNDDRDEPRPLPEFKPLNTLARVALIFTGTRSLGLGIVGAFLPVLPTTPFVPLAAIC